MEGRRELFKCPTCGKGFTFWVQVSTAQPKVKCSFCHAEFHPKGEAPPAEKPAPTPLPAEAPAA